MIIVQYSDLVKFLVNFPVYHVVTAKIGKTEH